MKVSEEVNVVLWDKKAFKRWNDMNKRQDKFMRNRKKKIKSQGEKK